MIPSFDHPQPELVETAHTVLMVCRNCDPIHGPWEWLSDATKYAGRLDVEDNECPNCDGPGEVEVCW